MDLSASSFCYVSLSALMGSRFELFVNPADVWLGLEPAGTGKSGQAGSPLRLRCKQTQNLARKCVWSAKRGKRAKPARANFHIESNRSKANEIEFSHWLLAAESTVGSAALTCSSNQVSARL